MKVIINCQHEIYTPLRRHLFQNRLEQAAFFLAQTSIGNESIKFEVVDFHLIPSEGWDYQGDLYLEMKDDHKARIMKLARDSQLALIDCHSHPFSGDDVFFSPTDRSGISEFSSYVKWKNDNRPFAAIVFGRRSFDGVCWFGDYSKPLAVEHFNISGSPSGLKTKRTWNKSCSLRRFFNE